MPKWRKGEVQLLLEVVSLGGQCGWVSKLRTRNLPSVEERVRRKIEGTDDTVAVGSVTRMTAGGSGPRSSEKEGDFLQCEVGVRQKDTEEEQRSLGQVVAPPQKRRAAIRVESAETQDHVSAHPFASHRWQRIV